MAVQVTNFTWRQTDDVIIIQVPLRGVHPSKADVFTFENYIKANFSPFLFEAFLYGQIREHESKCTLTENEIVFDLHKIDCGMWETLEAKLSKEQKKVIRQDTLRKSQERAAEEKEKCAVKKSELKRQAVREQMAIETKQREYIKNFKDAEKTAVTLEIEQWKLKSNNVKVVEIEDNVKPVHKIEEITEEKTKITNSTVHEGKINKSTKTLNSRNKISGKTNIISKNNDIFKDSFKGNLYDASPVPLPRESGCINVSFTPRQFPTPSRESQTADEEEWLKKQAEARRATGFVAEDLKPEERNPIWLKDKGDHFFQMGNYLGAISAYSHAIKIGSTMPSLYSNRAAAHLALGNYYRAHEDSSMALELLTPHVSMNAKSRARSYVRRATALCHLGGPEQALKDLEAAQALEPDDPKLTEDIRNVRELANKTLSADEEVKALLSPNTWLLAMTAPFPLKQHCQLHSISETCGHARKMIINGKF